MRAVQTWILVANTRSARALCNLGPGKGISQVRGACWVAEAPHSYSDRAGVGHSIAGPAVAAKDQADPAELAAIDFADSLAEMLQSARRDGRFERLVVVAGPAMLGLLRKALTADVRRTITVEVAKDLSHLTPSQLVSHLGEVMAV